MRLYFALVLSLACVAAVAQHPAEHAAPPPTLDDGLSDLHWSVSTSNTDAQRFFDQGMRYLYAFNHEQAVRSFTHATELDPELAIGYWGAALALGPNINMDVDPPREQQAFDAIHTAAAHQEHASQKERDLIAALMKRYSKEPTANLRQLAIDYSDAMRDVAKRYGDDADVATLYAESLMDLRPWKFWSHDGKAAEGTEEIVSTLEGVLKKHPRHIGANHYYIHAVEASSHPERALASAKRLETLAPAAGHLVHMPAHIYQRTGNYSGAARANELAADVDRDFIKRNGAENMYTAMYYNHNLQFGSASNAMIGRYDAAKTQAAEMASNAAPMLKEMPILEVISAAPMLVMARFGRWQDVLRATPVDAGPLSSVYSHFARGVAFARLGNISGAESEWKALEAKRAALGDENGILQNAPKPLGEVASRVLAGRIAEARGDRDAAIAEYTKAVDAEDALNYDEPADWFYPARETLGAALLRGGRAADAENVLRTDLAKNANNPRSLWLLARSLRAQKKNAAATTAAFHKQWRGGTLTMEDL
ncbi:MAG: Tetratricopeptide 2 repeat protein [Acidobacteria bacterium]|nr:Tetratricopeptide 2 repeat protein [Acidobacteriota bacterium]